MSERVNRWKKEWPVECKLEFHYFLSHAMTILFSDHKVVSGADIPKSVFETAYVRGMKYKWNSKDLFNYLLQRSTDVLDVTNRDVDYDRLQDICVHASALFHLKKKDKISVAKRFKKTTVRKSDDVKPHVIGVKDVNIRKNAAGKNRVAGFMPQFESCKLHINVFSTNTGINRVDSIMHKFVNDLEEQSHIVHCSGRSRISAGAVVEQLEANVNALNLGIKIRFRMLLYDTHIIKVNGRGKRIVKLDRFGVEPVLYNKIVKNKTMVWSDGRDVQSMEVYFEPVVDRVLQLDTNQTDAAINSIEPSDVTYCGVDLRYAYNIDISDDDINHITSMLYSAKYSGKIAYGDTVDINLLKPVQMKDINNKFMKSFDYRYVKGVIRPEDPIKWDNYMVYDKGR